MQQQWFPLHFFTTCFYLCYYQYSTDELNLRFIKSWASLSLGKPALYHILHLVCGYVVLFPLIPIVSCHCWRFIFVKYFTHSLHKQHHEHGRRKCLWSRENVKCKKRKRYRKYKNIIIQILGTSLVLLFFNFDQFARFSSDSECCFICLIVRCVLLTFIQALLRVISWERKFRSEQLRALLRLFKVIGEYWYDIFQFVYRLL